MALEQPGKDFDKEVLLIEYQKTQDSAQHHVSMSRTATNIMWAASLVLFGFVYNNLTDSKLSLLSTFICTLGIILSITVNMMDISLEKVVKQKYRRCKDIEDLLGMKQHSKLLSSGVPFRMFYNGITLLFVIMWSSTLWFIWCGNS